VDYWIGGVKILRATEFRDLGVVFVVSLFATILNM
jgi:hypothetical protein